MSGFPGRIRVAVCRLVAVGTAFAALACSGRNAGNETSSDEDDDEDVDGDDDGDDHDDDGNGDDDDGLTSDPDATADDDDAGTMTDPDGDDDADDGSASSDSGDGEQDPLEDMGEVEMVASGFAFAEGPVWVPPNGDRSGALLFTDIPADAIMRFDPSTDVIEPFVQGTGAYVNGLDLDALGNLLMCEGGNQRLTRREMDDLASLDVVADTWEGSPFNSPNDVATHESGSIFFTDPTYGTSPDFGGSPPVLGFQGIYRIDPAGEVSLVDDSLEQPNGVVISPDGDTMYVADTVTTEVFAYPLDGDGVPGARSLLFNVEGGGDGMTIDSDGNLYVAGAAGIEVWRGDGSERWGVIAMPDVPTNCAFGGDDLQVLYVTLPTQVVCVRLAVPGLEHAS